jgi:hypothetical protein
LASLLHYTTRRQIMEFQSDQGSAYRVEVSGWDACEKFFVEKSLLEWSVGEKKEVFLRSALHEGCVVFVRLLHPHINGANFLVAYRAEGVTARDPSGNLRVRLAQLPPRASFRETARLLAEAISGIA